MRSRARKTPLSTVRCGTYLITCLIACHQGSRYPSPSQP